MSHVNEILNSITYRCVVSNPVQGITIKGVLVQPPVFNFETQWEALINCDRSGSMSEAGMQLILGKSLINRYFSTQSWAGTSLPMFTITMAVVAMRSGLSEVLYPSAQALTTVLPTGSGFLNPPCNPKNESDRYKVVMGRIIRIRNLLPVSVEVTPEHVYVEDGAPVASTISMSFTSDKVVNKSEVLSWFGSAGGGQGSFVNR